METWNGEFRIESKLGDGTQVIIALPRAEPPAWFVPALHLSSKCTVVILDDDTSIHQIWKQRLEAAFIGQECPKLLHFSTPAQIKNWYRETTPDTKMRFLLDFELLGHSETGLDIIRSLEIGRQTILVTSRFEESTIISRCSELSVSMIPKGLAGIVPIFVEKEKAKPDAVLLDDDPLVHMVWKSVAKSKGKKLVAFDSPELFKSTINSFDLDTPIYLDSSLGSGIRGEDIARALSEQGFSSLYIATGYDAQKYEAMAWIKGVTGKDAPW